MSQPLLHCRHAKTDGHLVSASRDHDAKAFSWSAVGVSEPYEGQGKGQSQIIIYSFHLAILLITSCININARYRYIVTGILVHVD